MSPASSLVGEGFTMPSKLRNLYSAAKPDIKISFERNKKTYTTLDRLEGNVTITAPVDTRFDAVDIEFVGTSRTFVERMTTAAAASGRSEAFHQFLKLSQPDVSEFYPEDFVFRAGVSYTFPFIFGIPQQLLPRVCQHSVHNNAVRDAHLLLPPTFGDKDLAARQKSLDDMAPEMASVRYGIFAKITEVKARGDEAWRSTVASKARRVRVIPRTEVQAPLDVQMNDSEYVMRKEKTIRKGMLKGKAGTLIMEAAQPSPLEVQSYDNPEARTNTHATIMLRYDPFDDSSKPPKLGNLASKLKVSTFFSSCARLSLPTKRGSLADLTQGIHTEQFTLSSRCMANVEWIKQRPTEPQRRDSATSMYSVWTGGVPEPSEGYRGKDYYTARLVVPIQLPVNKAFVPTFHSCLISRTYTLKFELNVSSSNLSPSMDLKLPVQISSEGLVGDEMDRHDSVDAAADAEIDVEDVSNFFSNFMEPRTIRVPSAGFVGRSRIGSQAPVAPTSDSEEDAAGAPPPLAADAPPGYSPPVMRGGTARMTRHRAVNPVPVY